MSFVFVLVFIIFTAAMRYTYRVPIIIEAIHGKQVVAHASCKCSGLKEKNTRLGP